MLFIPYIYYILCILLYAYQFMHLILKGLLLLRRISISGYKLCKIYWLLIRQTFCKNIVICWLHLILICIHIIFPSYSTKIFCQIISVKLQLLNHLSVYHFVISLFHFNLSTAKIVSLYLEFV